MPPEQLPNPNEEILTDAIVEQNNKLDELNNLNEIQAQGIVESNKQLDELNRGVEMLVEQNAVKSTELEINLNGAEAVQITGPKGDKGDMPVKGKDYFTPAEVEEVVRQVQSRIKVPADGKDGQTPVRGVDYFTDDDIRLIVAQVAPLVPKGKDGKNGKTPKIDIDEIVQKVVRQLPNVRDGRDGSPDTPEQVKAKLLEAGLKYSDIKDVPTFRPASKTVSLTELDDVDLTGLTITNGKYVLDSGGAVDSVNGQTGVVVLDTGDIAEVTDKNYVSDAESTLLGGITASASELNILDGATLTTTELNYVDGVTSAIQTQLNGKEGTITSGTTGQYWRGDKTFQTLDKTAVGLSNVDNTSDATKNSATATLTNKRITKRTATTASTSSLTIDSDSVDIYTVTALALGMTINAPTGTPTQGQSLILRIKDNGSARALTWNATFKPIGITLPTTTVISKLIYIGMVYNSTSSQWDVLSVNQEV